LWDGEEKLVYLTPNTRYTLEHDFYPLHICKYLSQANVASANRALVDLDLEVNTQKWNYPDSFDSELMGDMEYPLALPGGRFLPRGTSLKISGGNANSSSYYVLIGFRPIKANSNEATVKMPYIYTITVVDCAQNSSYQDSVVIRPNTTFYLTHMIAIQRVIDTGGSLYLTEDGSATTTDILINGDTLSNTKLNLNTMFGTKENPRIFNAPRRIGENGSIVVNLNTPTWADGYARDIKCYFIGYHIINSASGVI
jgi:hypothetical protein